MSALYVSARWHVKTHEFDRQVSSYNIRDLNLPEDDVEWVRKAALKTPVILYPKLAGNPYQLFVVVAASVEDGMAQIHATANTLQTKECCMDTHRKHQHVFNAQCNHLNSLSDDYWCVVRRPVYQPPWWRRQTLLTLFRPRRPVEYLLHRYTQTAPKVNVECVTVDPDEMYQCLKTHIIKHLCQ